MAAVALAALCSAVVAALLCASCASRDSAAITMLYCYPQPQQLGEVLRAYRRARPGAEVRTYHVAGGWGRFYAKLSTLAAADDLPDIICAHNTRVIYYAQKGLIQPLDSFFSRRALRPADFHPKLIDAVTYGGKIWALPLNCQTFAMYYNKTMFDAAGLDYPDHTWTWEDFVHAGSQLTADLDGDGQPDQFGSVAVPPEILLWAYGAEITTADGKRIALRSPQALRALNLLRDMTHKYHVCPQEQEMEGQGNASDLFQAGKIGMLIFLRAYTAAFQHIEDFEWDVAPIPRGPAGRACPLRFVALCLARNTKRPRQAWDLMCFLAGQSGASILITQGRDVPALREQKLSARFLSLPRAPAHSQVFLDALDYSRTHPAKGVWLPFVQDDFTAMVQSILSGRQTVEQAVDSALPKMQSHLDQFWEQFGQFDAAAR